MAADDELRTLLARYLDEDDRTSLQAACKMLRGARVDMAALLDWLDHHRGDAERKSLAVRQVRAALGLPLIAGPVCRR